MTSGGVPDTVSVQSQHSAGVWAHAAHGRAGRVSLGGALPLLLLATDGFVGEEQFQDE